jgi:mannose-6-phosphate isomerase-like protein (cupin superfamily)
MSGYVVPPGDGRSFGPGISVKVEHGASPDFAVFESVVPPLWPGPGAHLHRSYDDAIYVLDGTIVFTLDGVERTCPAGSFVFVPRGCNRSFANRSADPARILPVTTPGAIRLVEELFSIWSGLGTPECKQTWTMRKSILRRSRLSTPSTTANSLRSEDTARQVP